MSEEKIDKWISDMALNMTRVCVRNTIIENFHADGKLSDEDMKVFNKEVADKIYTYLQLYLNPKFQEDGKLLFSSPYFTAPPAGWDQPKFDHEFMNAINILKEK